MNSAAFRFVTLLLIALAALLFEACSHQTVLTKSASAPTAAPLHFTKIFVLALVPDDFNRRLVEVAVKEQVTNVPVVAGYQYLEDTSDLKSKDKVFKAIKDSGADGLVVMRLVSMDHSVTTSTTSQHP